MMNFMKKQQYKITRKINYKINQFEQNKTKIHLLSKPYIYVLGLTNACNLQCPLCVTGLNKQTKKIEFMDIKLFHDIIRKIAPYASSVLLYNWGESLLHPYFEEVLELSHYNNLRTSISSNLSLSDIDNKLKAMVKYELNHLIVSFDGTDQEDYSRYRQGGNYEIVKRNISKITEYKKKYNSIYPIITLQYLVTKHTSKQINYIKNNYKTIGADRYEFYPITSVWGDNKGALLKDWITEDEYKKRSYFDIDFGFLGKRCDFIYSTMIIEQDGSIAPCCYTTNPMDDFTHWDDSKPITQMFNSEKFLEARKLFSDNNYLNDNIACNRCSMLKGFRKKE